ncbi:MAG: efflux RND transporter permease subunit [Planctomycetota bacterium]|nr:efflux RND transporter permease subunit [Planctomycetota bacterium]
MIAACLRHPWLVGLASLLLAVAGLWAWRHLAVDALPDLSDNQVIVWATWSGASPEDIDEQVTRPLARALQGLHGARAVRGLSLSGSGFVYAIFADRVAPARARAAVLERLAQVQGSLPSGVQVRLGPDATALGQVFAFALIGGADLEQARWHLEQTVIPALAGLPGVAEVAPVGGALREYQVDIDPARLAAAGIGIDEVLAALRAAGRDAGAAVVERQGVESSWRVRGFLRSADDIARLPLRGDPLRARGLTIGDLAAVRIGAAPRPGLLADAAGERVGAIVTMRRGADPSAVIAAARQRLAELAPQLARHDLAVQVFYDRSQLIAETSDTLLGILAEELGVTVLVVLAFLLSVRASLAVAVVLPLGVLATVLLMQALGVPANIMSLAGIGIAIGVMVDVGIVIVENAAQHLHAVGRRHGAAAPPGPRDPETVPALLAAAREVARPLLTASATTIVSFLPIFLLDEQAGRLFTPLAITKTIAIAAAVALGLLLTPVLCRWLLPDWQLRRPWAAALAGLAAGLAGTWAASGLELPLDHGRWALRVPGWLSAPLAAALAAWVAWRLARERLVPPEENLASRAVAAAYDWGLRLCLAQRRAFVLALLAVTCAGFLVGLGWPRLSWPLQQAAAWCGADLTRTRLHAWLAQRFPGLDASFLPPLDEGALLFMPSLPPAAGLSEVQRVLQWQNRAIAAVPEVALVMGKLGRAETALDPAPLGMIETVVLLKPYREWPAQTIVHPDGRREHRPRTLAEVRAALAAATELPGVAPSWLQPIETRIVMLSTGLRATLALQLAGSDGEDLERAALAAARLIAGVPGAADVQPLLEGGKPYAELVLDGERLARFGVEPLRVVEAVEAAIGGEPVAWTVEGLRRYAVRLRVLAERRDDPEELAALPIARADGGTVPLSALVEPTLLYTLRFAGTEPAAWRQRQPPAVARALTPLSADSAELALPARAALPEGVSDPQRGDPPGPVTVVARRPSDDPLQRRVGPMAIRSENGQRVQFVLLNARGRGEAEVIAEAERRLRAALASGEWSLPEGTSWRWVGRYEQQQRAARTMTAVIALSFATMLVLILLGTRSLLVTAVIIACNVTVTVAGGLIAVWLAGAELTIAVAVGFLILAGVMFNDGILLGTYLHERFATAPDSLAEIHRRVFEAGLKRRRAAVMTTATTLLALVPVLWSEGRGAELMRPMVLPVIGGMIADTLSLFSVPVFYAWWQERRWRARSSPAA